MCSRRTAFTRRSRAAVVWTIGLFLLGQFALGLVLDYATPLTRFPSARAVLEFTAKEPSPPAVVFLGSSRTGAAIHPAEMNALLATEVRRDPAPRVINAAAPGGDAISAEFVLNRLLDSGVKPELVVMEVWPEAFNARSPFLIQHVVRQFNWEDVPSQAVPATRAKAGRLFAQARLVPGYTHRRQIVRDVKMWAIELLRREPASHRPPTDKLAAGPLDWDDVIRAAAPGPESDLTELSQVGARETVRKWLTPYQLAGPATEALERILTRCRAEGIRVLLVDMPACSAHRDEYTPEIRAQFTRFIDRLTIDHGCRFVAVNDWLPDSQYIDALHVSHEGGREFTRRFTRDVVVEALQK